MSSLPAVLLTTAGLAGKDDKKTLAHAQRVLKISEYAHGWQNPDNYYPQPKSISRDDHASNLAHDAHGRAWPEIPCK
jgi:hypothetical protein